MSIIMLVISFLFYNSIWQQVITQENQNVLTIQGESPDLEFVAETVRSNILAGKNPFATATTVMFPHGWKFAMDDVGPINGFFYLVVRPFFSTHQSLMLITLLAVVAGGVLMDALLLRLGIKSAIAWIMALVFAYTPIVTTRIGAHQTYPPLYVFPWSALIVVQMIKVKKITWRSVVVLGLSWAVMVLTNLNYTLMWGVMAIGLWCWCYLYYRREVWQQTIAKIKYLVGAGIIAIVILLPWLTEAAKVVKYEPADLQTGSADIMAYSANLTNFLVPSKSNSMYIKLTTALNERYPNLNKIIEDFVYPGVILLLAVFLYSRFAKQLPRWLRPIFGTAMTFFLISLGPQLQVGSHIYKVPLPYSLIAHIPYIQMARAPARFVIPVIFLMTIIAAHVIQYHYLRVTKSRRWVLLAIVLVVFWFDQRAVPKAETAEPIPGEIYRYLKEQDSLPLLELPFAVRDGVKYHGHLHSHWNIVETLTHGQPIFGIYAGRINNPTFAYFVNNPVTGSLGQVIDLATTDPQLAMDKIDQQKLVRGLDFYGVKHVLLKDGERYTEGVRALFEEIGLVRVMGDNGYELWEREPYDLAIRAVKFDGQDEDLTLLSGWSPPEPGTVSRWAMSNEAEIVLSFQPKAMEKLVIYGSPLDRAQKVKIMINDEYVGKMIFPRGGESRQELMITRGLKLGVNKISLQFAHTTVPTNSWLHKSEDKRPLALKVSYVGMKE
ncbi:MAG: hypothetical protein ABII21_01995 [bacterium]